VHYVHIFEWVTGARVTGAAGFTRNLHSPGLEGEDLACAVLRLDSGALITLDMAWCSDGEEWAIHGTGGRIQYRSNRWLSIASSSGSFEGRVVGYSGGLVEAFGGPFGKEQTIEIRPPAFGDGANPLNQHRLFLEAARDERPAPVSIESGVHDMRVVSAVYESARSGRVVEVA
jgi:predicted dehydrogenase